MGFISVKREHSRSVDDARAAYAAPSVVRFYISSRPRSTGIPIPASFLVGRERISSAGARRQVAQTQCVM
jgi:hypothetical protein